MYAHIRGLARYQCQLLPEEFNLFQLSYRGQIIATKLPVGHPKWFSKGILPKCPDHSGLGNYSILNPNC